MRESQIGQWEVVNLGHMQDVIHLALERARWNEYLHTDKSPLTGIGEIPIEIDSSASQSFLVRGIVQLVLLETILSDNSPVYKIVIR